MPEEFAKPIPVNISVRASNAPGKDPFEFQGSMREWQPDAVGGEANLTLHSPFDPGEYTWRA